MLPEKQRAEAARRLADNVRSYGNHLTTGFLGTPYLCHVLTRFGYDSSAYKLLLQKSYPSWLYPVKMGATTIWERWDGIKPDSTFETPTMNSFNHYSYGAIGDWMYRVVAGIDTYEGAPGYKRIRIMPHTTDSVTYAKAELKTYYGTISSHWKRENNKLHLEIEIPANTKATVYVPANRVESVTEKNVPLRSVNGLEIMGIENGYVVVQVGSGKYYFLSTIQ
jgi:alpha-L-rhamnosidase